MNKRFKLLHEEIKRTLKFSKTLVDSSHSEQVRKFVLIIDPKASEELQIAALAHDIDRAVIPRTNQMKEESYEEYKQRHAKRSAEITTRLMRDCGYNQRSIKKVYTLIKNHEVGGDKDADILKDADSASYFANNIEYYFDTHGEKKTKEKIKYMYDRASDRTKDLIKTIKYSENIKSLINEVFY